MDSLKTAKILIVDDQAPNVVLMEKMLRADGYNDVYSTTDPRQVIELYAEHHFDLVLLDLNMPYLNGFEVMQQLKELESENYVPVLVLTAQPDMKTRLQALESGARDFLTKPFDRLEVLTRIRNMLEVRLMHKQIRDQNRILEEKVLERTRELAETRFEIIRRLGRAAEYRDNETGLHIIRMSKYSQLLGRAAGMNEEDAEMLLNASPMHDIGKIGIPDSILLKPGKLDPDQWEIMKTHSAIGAEILSGHPSELMTMASQIALTHHEKWDGSGYPNGLTGEEIPLVGRVVAVCDVFDALTTARPYKKAWTVEDALCYISENSGKHFDPELTQLCPDVLPAILEIRERYAEPDACRETPKP
ncbi:MAG: response regulator [Sulfurimicrobium sp.]|nr:response regulator [Sulfurimicrobium sp.]MDO9189610.1 response regulator [Sulfurimicrobium sp.]MDP2198105.1 response regulator [Sulfurimicrobium sp.]MDP2964239.1 response regulator [Sulfurimicrobium sp.]MDP3687516.1 response regulator [Sulfurimicrobium sp.]